jgi:malonyl-CoA/methylmalonyl-CoA synthetase
VFIKDKCASHQIFANAEFHQERRAILSPEGAFSYRQLLEASTKIASCLLAGKTDLRETRVAFLIPPGFQYVATQWGIWRAGGIAVPLCVSHPQPELEYGLVDSEAEIIIAHPDFAKNFAPTFCGAKCKIFDNIHGRSDDLPQTH